MTITMTLMSLCTITAVIILATKNLDISGYAIAYGLIATVAIINLIFIVFINERLDIIKARLNTIQLSLIQLKKK